MNISARGMGSQNPLQTGWPRWLVGGLLLVSGVLAVVAPLLPWVQESYPSIENEPAQTITYGPGQSLLYMLGSAHILSIEGLLQALIFLVLPLGLLTFGVVTIVRHDRSVTPNLRLGARLLVVPTIIAMLGTILEAVLIVSLAGAFDVIRPTATLEYGPILALLAYLGALIALLQFRARV